ncbi:MAG: zf-HC2 domain-containing protein [Candidatus Latescibacteria bacterium]|nr:zf-HC2 domain-containing protein [Candidatus Latescibacterota bacterium]
MNCRDIEKLLPEYAAQCLDDTKAGLVREHLETCSSCRKELAGITELFEYAKPSVTEDVDAPDGYYDELWPSLYSRIRDEGLDKPSLTVMHRIREFTQSYRHRAFVYANVALILIASIWLYTSYRGDKGRPGTGYFQKIVESFSPGTKHEPEEKTGITRTQTAELPIRNLNITDTSVKAIGTLINPEKQEKMYDSLTDYLAEKLITLDKITSPDKEGIIENGSKQKNT